jgi:hypothetical protein
MFFGSSDGWPIVDGIKFRKHAAPESGCAETARMARWRV